MSRALKNPPGKDRMDNLILETAALSLKISCPELSRFPLVYEALWLVFKYSDHKLYNIVYQQFTRSINKSELEIPTFCLSKKSWPILYSYLLFYIVIYYIKWVTTSLYKQYTLEYNTWCFTYLNNLMTFLYIYKER